MNLSAPPKFGLGAPVRRVEDFALTTGHGHYIADLSPEGVLHAHVVRSPVANAKFTIGDLEAAKASPGVHLILTADDLGELGPLPAIAMVPQPDGSMPQTPEYPVLPKDRVRHVGEAVAFIVADSVNAAKSAADLIEIDWEDLPVAMDLATVLDEGTPLVWPEKGTNKAAEIAVGDKAAMEEAFAKAHSVTEIELVNPRVITNYLDTRGCIAEYDAGKDHYTFTVGCQGVHGIRDTLCAHVLKIDPSQMRVIAPDIGGGFGTKVFLVREYPLTLFAAKKLGRPVKWVSERTEHFLCCSQGRDHLTHARLAFDEAGRILAVDIDITANMGAYINQFALIIPFFAVSMATGLYDIPVQYAKATCVFTNTIPVDAYRGAGRPEAAYLIERLMDQAALDQGIDRAEVRRRNFIAPDALPYTTPAGRMYDTGDFSNLLDHALDVADWAGFDARAAASKAAGKLRGIGLATYVEACAFAGSEGADLELGEDGQITLLIGTQTNGQGHATAYAQVAAEFLGLDIEQIKVIQGDTDRVKTGGGTGGSRSIPLGAASVDIAGRALAQKIKDQAADHLEASASDIELIGGVARVVGTDQSIGFADIARAAKDPDALKANGLFEQKEATYPNGAHICEVEIDPDTGVTELVSYTVVDDFGVTLNPLLLAGQVHGGIIQGAGQAFIENTVYDENGQLVTASFMDYRMPRAGDFPDIHFETRNVPSTTNMLGIKGAGEAGTIGSTPAVMSAVIDALRRGCGITSFDMPATPERVWQAIREHA